MLSFKNKNYCIGRDVRKQSNHNLIQQSTKSRYGNDDVLLESGILTNAMNHAIKVFLKLKIDMTRMLGTCIFALVHALD